MCWRVPVAMLLIMYHIDFLHVCVDSRDLDLPVVVVVVVPLSRSIA